jgi:hypothetical protein
VNRKVWLGHRQNGHVIVMHAGAKISITCSAAEIAAATAAIALLRLCRAKLTCISSKISNRFGAGPGRKRFGTGVSADQNQNAAATIAAKADEI